MPHNADIGRFTEPSLKMALLRKGPALSRTGFTPKATTHATGFDQLMAWRYTLEE